MSASSTTSAPLWRRLMAMLYDSLLLVAVILFYVALHLGIKILLLGSEYLQLLHSAPAGSTTDPLLFPGVLASIYLFFFSFWRRNGQTLGMQVWRIRVQQSNGTMITARQTLLRLLIAPLSLLCLGVGYFWCLFGPGKTWQDIGSHSQVILLPKLDTQ